MAAAHNTLGAGADDLGFTATLEFEASPSVPVPVRRFRARGSILRMLPRALPRVTTTRDVRRSLAASSAIALQTVIDTVESRHQRGQ